MMTSKLEHVELYLTRRGLIMPYADINMDQSTLAQVLPKPITTTLQMIMGVTLQLTIVLD